MNRTTRTLASIVAAVALLTSAGCAKHKDFPTPLSLVTPPTPSNLVVTDDGGGRYTLTWNISNSGVVDHYNLYSVSAFGTTLQATTATTDIGVDLLTGVPVPGLVFGVSVVTVENVEGAMVTGVTPEPTPPAR